MGDDRHDAADFDLDQNNELCDGFHMWIRSELTAMFYSGKDTDKQIC